MTLSTNNLVQCKFCLHVLPHEESYKRKNCNERCNEQIYAHEECYSSAMSVKSFVNKKCPWCSVHDPEGTSSLSSLSTRKLAAMAALSGAIYVAGIITAVSLKNYINNECYKTDGKMCSTFANLAGQLISLPFLCTAIRCGFPAGFCLFARCKRF